MGVQDQEWLKLTDREEVLWWGHPSLVMYVGELTGGLSLLVLGIVLPLLDFPYDQIHPDARMYLLVLIPIGLAIIAIELVRRKYTYYVVTTDKVWKKTGVIGRDRDPVHFDRAVNTKVNETTIERIASILIPGTTIGDITIMTADDTEPDLHLKDVPNIEQVSQLVEEGMNSHTGAGHASGTYGSPAQNQVHNTGQNETRPPQRPEQNQPRQNEGQHRQPPRGDDGRSQYPDTNGRHEKDQTEPWDDEF